MAAEKIRIGVIGASGYTGADLVRLAARHPGVDIAVLTANTHAGKPVHEVFPHLGGLALPILIKNRSGLVGNRCRVLRIAACHKPGGHRQAATGAEDHRHVSRFSPA